MGHAQGIWFQAVLLIALGTGCAESSPLPTQFESDLPGSAGGRDSGEGGGNGGAPTSDDGDDPGRTIEEADIIQVDGDTLYALSRYGGLSVIDVSDPAAMRTLGHFRRAGVPFEGYRRGDVLLAMYSEYGHWEARDTEDGEAWDWASSSQVLALDVANPAKIVELGAFSIPGNVSDSRIVGDVLYVVAHEDGYCWGCTTDKPRTTVGSFNIANPKQMSKVDELIFDDVNDDFGWGPRSITVTAERMYVAGREYDAMTGASGSTIQVVDIRDPAGAMKLGTTLEAKGQITSRWQMDEHEGVLRVVSQAGEWRPEDAPTLQTFQVKSAEDITPLASLALQIPEGESLRSVRFDGPRGYAITFEQTDPLFTLDLSDPAMPKQVGELVIPGFVYHMEPRGERVIGLGYDQGNPDGALHVSVFDVSNLAEPKQLARVNFGGDYASLPEDQDRIQKAFKLLDELELILVPWSGWDNTGGVEYCWGQERNAVQLIDWKGDDLTLRGEAETRGQPRRSLIHADHLLTVSDEAVQAFDVTNRDEPAEKSQRRLARFVSSTAVVGDHLARLGENWWSRGPDFDIVPLATPDEPDSLATIQLDEALALPDSECRDSLHVETTFVHEDLLYAVYSGYDYDGAEGGKERRTDGIAVFDLSDPKQPELVATVDQMRGVDDDDGFSYSDYDLVPSGKRVVQIGSTLVFQRGTSEWRDDERVRRDAWLDVIDLSAPKDAVVTRVNLPGEEGLLGLVTDGNDVLTSHYEVTDSGRGRFYVDRVSVAKPREAKLVSSINVPGSLFAVTGDDRILTVAYAEVVRDVDSAAKCNDVYGFRASFKPTNEGDYAGPGTCSAYESTLHAVRLGAAGAEDLDAVALAAGEWPAAPVVTEDRVFFGFVDYGGYWVDDCWGPCGFTDNVEGKLAYLSNLEENTLSLHRATVEGRGFSGSPSLLAAHGKTALMQTGWGGGLLRVRTADVDAPALESVVGPEWTSSVTISGDTALCSGGYAGVRAVSLAD